jgi:hypothetical protein
VNNHKNYPRNQLLDLAWASCTIGPQSGRSELKLKIDMRVKGGILPSKEKAYPKAPMHKSGFSVAKISIIADCFVEFSELVYKEI